MKNNPNQALEHSRFRQLLARAIIFPLMAAVVCAGLLAWQVNRLMQVTAWVDHADRVISNAFELQKLMLDAETGVRGYYAAGLQEYLEPYNKALTRFPEESQHLRELVADNPKRTRQLDSVEANWRQWLAWEQNLIAMKGRGQDVTAIYRTMEGKRQMDEIRKELIQFRAEEEQIRNSRVAQVRVSHRRAIISIFGLTTILAVIGALFTRRSMNVLSNAYRATITKLKELTVDLLESREWFSTSLASIGDAVIAVDLEARISFMNPVAERLTGWNFSAAKGRKMLEVFNIVNEETGKPAFNPVEKVLKDGTIVGLANHTVLIAKDGREYPIEDSAAPIRVNSDKTLGVILVFRDVTEKNVQQERLENLNFELRESIQYRDDFLSLASHELKTPLTSLKLMTQMAERQMRLDRIDTLPPSELGKMMTLYSKQVASLTRLVDDLLDVSRIRAHKLSYNFEDVDLAELVRNQVDKTMHQFKEAGSEVILQMDGPVRLKADPVRIEQVVNNLLSNAIKYGGGKPVTVSVEHNGGTATLRVQDSGIGIAKNHQTIIFGRFERALTSTNISGLGLGLYIAREILSSHGGTIAVESEPGKGSVFIVELPAYQEREISI